MAPKNRKKVELEEPFYISSDEDAKSDKEGSEAGGIDAAMDAQPNYEQSLDGSDASDEPGKPETKKKTIRKTDEEKKAAKARGAAAIEALLSDRFVWKNGKPEPFEKLREDSDCNLERSEDESTCDYVDRLHENWKELERTTLDELLRRRDAQQKTPIDEEGEVEYVTFEWKGRKVLCETFLKIDLSDKKDFFKSSRIPEKFKEQMRDYDESMKDDRLVRAELVKYLAAGRATNASFDDAKAMKDLISDAYEEIDSRERTKWKDWINAAKKALKGKKTEFVPNNRKSYKSNYESISDKWEDWGSGRKEWTVDKKMNNDRNLFASDPKNNILRRPHINSDLKAIYIAFDRSDKLMIFLDPQGVPWSYGDDIHKIMKEDAHEFFTTIKPPNAKSNKRHISQRQHSKENTALKSWWCGSDHYGHWHAAQHTNEPMIETADSLTCNATQRQLLLQLLKYTGGAMTRVLDFWFGVWEPELRRRYRDIYANSPEFARLPPVNKDHPETYCLRVAVCNRPTDEHRDQADMKGGLTGLVHLGDFKGAAMCFNKLGIALDGYGDGAVLLLRGTELHHYISHWTGKYRYAFDHTTHQSTEASIIEHEGTGRWGPSKESKKSAAPRRPYNRNVKKSDKDDDNQGGGDAPARPQPETKKRKFDDNGEGPSGESKAKKPKKGDGGDGRKAKGGKVAARAQGTTKTRPREVDEDGPAAVPPPKKHMTRLDLRRMDKGKQAAK